MQAKSAVNRYDLQNGHVDFRATLVPNRMDSTRRRQLLDSLQQVYPSVARDSLFAYHRSRTQMRSRSRKDDFSGSDLDLSLDKSAAEMLRRWDASGSVKKAASGRLLTPYFPLTNTLQNVDIAFTTDAVKLKNTQIQSGQSSLELTGEISNLRRVLLGRGQLKIKMNIESDTLNFNELIHAATVGAQYEKRFGNLPEIGRRSREQRTIATGDRRTKRRGRHHRSESADRDPVECRCADRPVHALRHLYESAPELAGSRTDRPRPLPPDQRPESRNRRRQHEPDGTVRDPQPGRHHHRVRLGTDPDESRPADQA